MSTKTDGGGPALPHEGSAEFYERSGMTLRDYFAAKAIFACVWAARQEIKEDGESFSLCDGGTDAACVAIDAYALADAMLEERNTQ